MYFFVFIRNFSPGSLLAIKLILSRINFVLTNYSSEKQATIPSKCLLPANNNPAYKC